MADQDQIVAAPGLARPVTWGTPDAAAGWVAGFLLSSLTAFLAYAASDTPFDEPATELSLGWRAIAQLGLWVGLVGASYLVARLKGNGIVRDFGLRVEPRDIGVGAFVGLVGQFAIVWLVYVPMGWFTDVTTEEFTEPAREMTERATSPVGVVLLVLIVGIGAPIAEEIFYRGLLQRSLVRRLGALWGIALASLVFGLVHFQLLQLPSLALAGVLFGVLAHRAGRLGPAIVAHMVFNLTAVTALLVAD